MKKRKIFHSLFSLVFSLSTLPAIEASPRGTWSSLMSIGLVAFSSLSRHEVKGEALFAATLGKGEAYDVVSIDDSDRLLIGGVSGAGEPMVIQIEFSISEEEVQELQEAQEIQQIQIEMSTIEVGDQTQSIQSIMLVNQSELVVAGNGTDVTKSFMAKFPLEQGNEGSWATYFGRGDFLQAYDLSTIYGKTAIGSTVTEDGFKTVFADEALPYHIVAGIGEREQSSLFGKRKRKKEFGFVALFSGSGEVATSYAVETNAPILIVTTSAVAVHFFSCAPEVISDDSLQISCTGSYRVEGNDNSDAFEDQGYHLIYVLDFTPPSVSWLGSSRSASLSARTWGVFKFNDFENAIGRQIIITSSEKRVVVGSTGSFDGEEHLFIASYSSDFHGRWGKYISGESEGWGVVEDEDGALIVVGILKDSNRRRSLLVVKFSSTGDTQGWVEYEDKNWNEGRSITIDQNGDFIAVGSTSAREGGESEILVVKIPKDQVMCSSNNIVFEDIVFSELSVAAEKFVKSSFLFDLDPVSPVTLQRTDSSLSESDDIERDFDVCDLNDEGVMQVASLVSYLTFLGVLLY